MSDEATPAILTIAGAEFLNRPNYRHLVAVLEAGGDVAWAVGGAVRNTLLGLPVADVDIATTALPAVVMARARAAGFGAVPTGIDHGTVTVIVDHVGYEVTTLRSDLTTDGRRATVAFTRNVAEDAARRDFTMNALYADLEGRLIDVTCGIKDTLARRVRFIGQASERIAEDYLRILRFFRFHAAFGAGAPDADGLTACIALQEGIERLSRERIGQEMRKLLVAPGAPATVRLMTETGILQRVLGGACDPETFAALAELCRATGVQLDPPLALAALAAWAPGGAARLGERLRLSRAEQDQAATFAALADTLGPAPDRRAVKLAVYRHGNAAAVGALLLAAARGGAGAMAELEFARCWEAPRFPVTGRDLLVQGQAQGPALGRRLAELEAAWIADDFGAGSGSPKP